MIQFMTLDERPDLAQRYAREAEDFWPPHMQFVYHDPVCEAFWPRLKLEFPAFQHGCPDERYQYGWYDEEYVHPDDGEFGSVHDQPSPATPLNVPSNGICGRLSKLIARASEKMRLRERSF